jgi:tetratricopeptide (TPR) repeat protein
MFRSEAAADSRPMAVATDGLDAEYDYTQAFPHKAAMATTPTPTSASARGMEQTQYYNPPKEGEVDADGLPSRDALNTEEVAQYDTSAANEPSANDPLLDLAQLEQLQLEAERLKAQGNKAMAAQDYVAAYHAYSAALQLSPVGPASHVFLSNRAAALLSLKRYPAAATDARRAIALAPTFGKAHARLGQALYFMKDYASAVAAYQDAVHYEPDNAVTRAYLEKAEEKLAKQQQQVGSVRSGDDATSVVSPMQNCSVATDQDRGHGLVQQHYAPVSTAARTALQTVVQEEAEVPVEEPAEPPSLTPANHSAEDTVNEDPEFTEALRIQQRANQFLVTKQYRQAIEEYTAALFLVPDDIQLSPDLHLGRAHALNGSRRHESARNDALLALKLQPNSAAAYSTLAKSLFYLKDYAGAIAAFDQCRAQLPQGEALGLFDQAYLEKAERALAEEEDSLNQAGKPSPHRSPALNRSFQSASTTSVPKLPPPRFVPREEAIQKQSTPPARPMPKEWPQQSPTSRIPLRCGPEHAVVCISEGLGLKLNRGSDGIVRVLSVTDANTNPHIVRRGEVLVGDVVREAAGVDIRRPITNVMWGDTVALLRMAPRPITLLVAPELSPVPPAVLLEQQRAAANSTAPMPGERPSNSSGDDAVRKVDAASAVSEDGDDDAEDSFATAEHETDDPEVTLEEDEDDIVECDDATPDAVPPKATLTLDTVDEEEGDGGSTQPSTSGDNIVLEHDDDDVIDDDGDVIDDDGIESVEEETSPSTVVLPSKKKKSHVNDEVAFETVQKSLREEEDRVVGGEILFLRDAHLPAYGGWDTLRWMSYNGARKVNFCQPVFRLEDGIKKKKSLPVFWKTGGKHYLERSLIVYDEPSLMMIVRRPTSLEEIRSLLGLPDSSSEAEESTDGGDWAINPDTAMSSYWILESVADPASSKLRLSPLTTPTSVAFDGADDRERSCFQILTPAETISLSAVSVRTEVKKREQSFADSGAFLETLSVEASIAQAICGAHSQSADLGSSEADIAWKHQVIIGSLHSLVLSGNSKALDDGMEHARLALSRGNGNMELGSVSSALPSRIVDAVDDNGYPALYYACSHRMDGAIRRLIFAGADPTFRIELNGLTMLHMAARKLDFKTLSTLLVAMSEAKKLNANILDKKGRTPLYVAMVEGSVLDGGKSPSSLGQCMAVLISWGGLMMPPTSSSQVKVTAGTNASSTEVLRNPVSALAYMWLSDYIAIAFEHISYRFPLKDSSNGPTCLSLGALYQYPLHSALIALRKYFRKGGNALSDCRLIPTLKVLLKRGYEPNERLDTRAFGSTRTSFDEFMGFSPLQILAVLALELDAFARQADFDEITVNCGMQLMGDATELLVRNGARLSLDPPLASRLREKVADSSAPSAEVEADDVPRRMDLLSKKLESDKQILTLLGGEPRLSSARREWSSMKKVATTMNKNLAGDNDVFSGSASAGGSDSLSCAICWSVFGSLMNRKHKCRVTVRYVCDDCSCKRLVQVCSEYRLSDGQFNLARQDAIHEQEDHRRAEKGSVPTPVCFAEKERNVSSPKSSEYARTMVRLDRLEAEQQANRDSLFGGVLEAATNFVMGGGGEVASSPSTSMSGLTASLDQTRDALNERGEKLSTLNDKSAKLVDASSDFAKMATELRKQSEKGLFW